MSSSVCWRLSFFSLVVALLVGCAISTRQPAASSVGETAAGSDSARGNLDPGRSLIPLESSDPRGGREGAASELEVLRRWLGDARVVGMGESLHGVHEFHRFGHRFFAELAERGEFDVYALEIDLAHAILLDQYVQGRRDDLDAILAQRWWSAIFYDEALVDLLRWMRTYNQTATQKVHLAGFDMKQPELAAAAIVERLGAVDAGAAAELAPLYQRALGLGGFGVFPNVQGFTATVSWPIPAGSLADSVRISMRLRGSGVSRGSVGFNVLGLEADGGQGERATQVLLPVDIAGEWRPMQIDYPLSPATKQLRITFFHRGNGTVWFSGLDVRPSGNVPEASLEVASADVAPLLFPELQVQDYRAFQEADPTLGGAPVLRVVCDAAGDRALSALREAEARMDASLEAHASELSSEAAQWVLRLALTLRQAVEWRVLEEPNRDRFLARNVEWLQRGGFPGARVVVLAHTVHTERIPERMGGFLSSELGQRYKTVSLLALAGQYRYFGDPRSSGPNSPLELFTIGDRDRLPLATALAKELESDLLFDVAGAAKRPELSQTLRDALRPTGDRIDIAVLLRNVTPLRPLP